MKTCVKMGILWLCVTGMLLAQEKDAPDFSLPMLDGKTYRLSEHIGEGVILINFWATWCIPCHSEMKALRKIYQKYHDQGLEILSISIDDPKTVSKVKGFVRSKKYPFTILLDTNNEVFQLYRGSNPPLSVLINQQGKIVYTHTGYRKGDEKALEEHIQKLLTASVKQKEPEKEER
ncbi:MAG: TlpA family protein disulfide reductase [Calditrichaeota bacterium]|nr:MAG: TlpA family protein disulfide reductase [Calditrichota bacterium]